MRAAIIGLGRIGMAHYRAYRACGAEVVAVCGRTPESVQAKVALLDPAICAMSVSDMLARNDIDIVSICTPPELHAPQVIMTAEARKHMVIEKPVALCVSDLDNMRSAVEFSGVKTGTSFVWRWLPGVQALIRRRADIGKIVHMRADFWNGRRRPSAPTSGPVMGTMARTGCHAVDMMMYVAGSRVSSVRALGTQKTLSLLLELKNGSTATVTSSDEASRPLGFSLSVGGSSGSLELALDGGLSCAGDGDTRYGAILPPRKDPHSFESLPFATMVGEFLRSIKNGTDTTADFSHTAHVHRICFAAEESAKKGGETIHL